MTEYSTEISSRTTQSGETIERKTFITKRYTGEKKGGKPNGQGVQQLSSGSQYNGSWFNGKKHGKGVFKTWDGKLCDFTWENDKAHGKGVITFKDGTGWKHHRGASAFIFE